MGFLGAALVRPVHRLWNQGLALHAAQVTDWTEKHPTCLGWHPEPNWNQLLELVRALHTPGIEFHFPCRMGKSTRMHFLLWMGSLTLLRSLIAAHVMGCVNSKKNHTFLLNELSPSLPSSALPSIQACACPPVCPSICPSIHPTARWVRAWPWSQSA